MTKFKQGDRVVPERFEDCNHNIPYFSTDMEPLVGVPGEITKISPRGHCEVHGWYWPEHALRPASPKWEPKVGDRVQYNPAGILWTDAEILTISETSMFLTPLKDPNTAYRIPKSNIRPIAPPPEEGLKELLQSWVTGPNNFLDTEQFSKLVMEWHNHHKEGGGGR